MRMSLHLTASQRGGNKRPCHGSPGMQRKGDGVHAPVSLAGVCLFVCCRHMAEAAHAVADKGGSALPERLQRIVLPCAASPLTTPFSAPRCEHHASPSPYGHGPADALHTSGGITPEQSLDDAADQVTCTQKLLMHCATKLRGVRHAAAGAAAAPADSECASNAASSAVDSLPEGRGSDTPPGVPLTSKQAFAQALLDHWDQVDAELCAWIGVRCRSCSASFDIFSNAGSAI